jgi:hypothetical protein
VIALSLLDWNDRFVIDPPSPSRRPPHNFHRFIIRQFNHTQAEGKLASLAAQLRQTEAQGRALAAAAGAEVVQVNR